MISYFALILVCLWLQFCFKNFEHLGFQVMSSIDPIHEFHSLLHEYKPNFSTIRHLAVCLFSPLSIFTLPFPDVCLAILQLPEIEITLHRPSVQIISFASGKAPPVATLPRCVRSDLDMDTFFLMTNTPSGTSQNQLYSIQIIQNCSQQAIAICHAPCCPFG